ncbi:hypothetical protein [Thermococcus sp.]|uniref:hypothetical protein n=1 Tax=Thermococcus sp. TaxID=35749 RepID=UPI00342141CD
MILLIGTRSLAGLPYVLSGAFLASVTYTLLGLGISAPYRDLDDYFMPILGAMVVSHPPFAHYHGYLRGNLKGPLRRSKLPGVLLLQSSLCGCFNGYTGEVGSGFSCGEGVACYFAKIRFYKYAVEGLR